MSEVTQQANKLAEKCWCFHHPHPHGVSCVYTAARPTCPGTAAAPSFRCAPVVGVSSPLYDRWVRKYSAAELASTSAPGVRPVYIRQPYYKTLQLYKPYHIDNSRLCVELHT